MDEQPKSSGIRKKPIKFFLTNKELEKILESVEDDSGSEYFLSDSTGSDADSANDENEEYKMEDSDTNDNDSTWTNTGELNNFLFTGNTGLLRHPDGSTPMDFFNLLVDQNFYEHIVEQTNIYATEIFLSGAKEQSRISQWKDLNIPELRKFIGLMLHMGTIQINRIQDYWKKNRLYNFSCFSQHMGRNRFLLILRCLYFAKNPDPNAPTPNRTYKINPIIDYCNNKMLEVYYPGKELSLYESMVLFRGRLKFRQYIQGDRHKYGVKLYVLTEPNGLTLKYKIYTSSDDITSSSGYTQNALFLLQQVLHKGHAVYMDNYYNSYSLAQRLLSCNTYCTGILRKMRKGNCKEIVQAKLKKGEIIAKYQRGVVMGKWQDRREVLFISTEHNAHLSDNANKRGEVKQKPNAIIKYNQFMGGVDKKDQMLSYYGYERNTLIWYTKIWIHVLETMLLNSYFLYNKYSQNTKMNFYDYRLKIIDTLLFENELVVSRVVPTFVLDHLPLKLERSEGGYVKRKRCKVCYESGIRKNTAYYCQKCVDQPGLCIDPCFRLFHSK